mgnify:CR=1 FL=1|jgi:hypothetical protein
MKRLLFLGLMLCSSLFLSGQNIALKSLPNASASSKLTFTTARLSGLMKASPDELVLTLKNTSKQPITLDPSSLALTDITGRGKAMCGDLTVLSPGEKTTLRFTPCGGNPQKGFFDLSLSYTSKAAFKEEAFFLRGKKFQLRGLDKDEVVYFYTDL